MKPCAAGVPPGIFPLSVVHAALRASQLAGRLPTISAKKKVCEYRRCRCGLGREIVRISLSIRNLDLINFERERLIDRVNKTVDIVSSSGSLDPRRTRASPDHFPTRKSSFFKAVRCVSIFGAEGD
jgi:hypothetical protein